MLATASRATPPCEAMVALIPVTALALWRSACAAAVVAGREFGTSPCYDSAAISEFGSDLDASLRTAERMCDDVGEPEIELL